VQRDEFVVGRSTVRRRMSMAITDTCPDPVSLRPPLACVAQPAVLQGEKTRILRPCLPHFLCAAAADIL